MKNRAHEEMVKELQHVDRLPATAADRERWLAGREVLDWLERNITQDELVIYASGRRVFLRTVVLDANGGMVGGANELCPWDYQSGGGLWGYNWNTHDMQVLFEQSIGCSGQGRRLDSAEDLGTMRNFETSAGQTRRYYSLDQRIEHGAEAHWQEEHGGYCKADEHGDTKHVVTVTLGDSSAEGRPNIVTMDREELELYTGARQKLIVRLFDVLLIDWQTFVAWGKDVTRRHEDKGDIFFEHGRKDGHAFLRGAQIVRLQRPWRITEREYIRRSAPWTFEQGKTDVIQFEIYDWRYGTTKAVTNEEEATTSYAAAAEGKPFDISPCFFRPEVMLKYKGQSTNYRLQSRELTKKGAWELQCIDRNEYGQVHVYIGDLRKLPIEEQRHWKEYNESPAGRQFGRYGPISERAERNDFDGDFWDPTDGYERVKAALRQWKRLDITWWREIEGIEVEDINPVYTENRNEWEDELSKLYKAVIEGFKKNQLLKMLQGKTNAGQKRESSLLLLERLMRERSGDDAELSSLHELHKLRVVSAHATGTEGEEHVENILDKHRSYVAHYDDLCERIAEELEAVTRTLGPGQ